MLQSKDIKKVCELKNGFTHSWLEPDFIVSSLKCFSFSKTCKTLNPFKLKGYSFESIFSILICLPFLGIKTINRGINSPLLGYIKAKKDTFYRLKNSQRIYWRMVLWLFAMKFNKLIISQSTADEDSLKCLIFDDSTLEKTGKTIEKISRVWDHVSHRFVLGYKLLTMGYWDGISFIPLDFSLHREKGRNKEKPYGLKKKEYKKVYRKKREKDTHSWDRAKEAEESKIKCAIKMFWRAVSQGLKIDYVLLDSWFTCEEFINAIKKVKNQNIHLIGMYKTPKTKFDYLGKKFDLLELLSEILPHFRFRLSIHSLREHLMHLL